MVKRLRLLTPALFAAVVTCTENRTPTSLGPPGLDAPTAQSVSGITQSVLTSGNDLTNQKIYTSASIAPAANALITVAVLGHNSTAAPASPTLSGGGMTAWTVVSSVTFDGVATPHKRLTIYRALAAAPTSGPLTITWASSVSNCQWIVVQWNGVDGSGTNGSGAVGQTGSNQADASTGLSVGLGAFGNTSNASFGVFGIAKSTPGVTPGAGFAGLAEQASGESPASDLAAESSTNDPSIDATWASANAGALGVEIVAGQSGPPPTTSTLSLTISGTGSVAFSPAPQPGGTCASPATATCTAIYLTTDNATLTATAPAGWMFTGWTGACTGTGSCALAMSANRSVTATFAPTSPTTHTLTLTIVSTGQVTFSVAPQTGGTCASPATASCTAVFLNTDNVTLTPGTGFTGWSGDCSGTGTCAVAMSADHAVTVTFSSGGGGGGPITQTLLTSGNNAANQKVYTTAAIAPAPNALITVAVMGHASTLPAIPTVTGGGMSAWTVVSSITFDAVSSAKKRLTVFRALAAAPGSGPLTITFAKSVSNCQWIVMQWSGVDPSGTNGAGAIAQAGSATGDGVTGLTVNLAAFGNTSDVGFGVFGIAKNTAAVTPGSGFTELAEQPSAEGTQSDLEAESQVNRASINATWASANGGAMGFEIKAGGSGGPPPLIDLSIDRIYVTQATQTLSGGVPLVTGRPALVRVFVRASQSSSTVPSVKISFFNGATLLQATTVLGTQPATTAPSEADLSTTWNLAVPGTLIQPGISITAQVDADNLIAESNESNNSASYSESPRTVFQQNFRFVPVKQTGSGLTGDVSMANVNNFADSAYRMYPLLQPGLAVHAVYTTNTPAEDGTDQSWSNLLDEMDALRVAEGSSETYVGVVKVTYTTGIVGIGYIGGPDVVVVDNPTWAGVNTAHELGHTFNRQHSPACGAGQPDPKYPYSGGVIGVYGTDAQAGPPVEYAPTIHDIMGYCDDNWVSDYTYKGVLTWVSSSHLMQAVLPNQRSLLVWGSTQNGVPFLEPSFVLTTSPLAPSTAGTYQVQGLDKDGAVIFTQGIEPTAVADVRDARGHFAFAVPLTGDVQSRLTALRITGPGGSFVRRMSASGAPPVAATWQGRRAAVTWDTLAAPAVMVRDAATGQVLSIGRHGLVNVETGGAELEVLLSNGVASTVQRLRALR